MAYHLIFNPGVIILNNIEILRRHRIIGQLFDNWRSNHSIHKYSSRVSSFHKNISIVRTCEFTRWFLSLKFSSIEYLIVKLICIRPSESQNHRMKPTLFMKNHRNNHNATQMPCSAMQHCYAAEKMHTTRPKPKTRFPRCAEAMCGRLGCSGCEKWNCRGKKTFVEWKK